MTTKIPVELSSTPGISDSSNATAITIDSSENVTITGDLNVTGGQINTGNTGGDHSEFGTDGSGHTFIDASTSGGSIFLQAGGTTKISMDSNGKIISNANGTGGTKATLADFTSSGSIRSILLKGAENTANQVFLDVVKDINGTETTLVSIADTVVQLGGSLTFNGDTATANQLDDYEEGTFNPGASISGASGSIAYNSTNDHLNYTKIGDMVHIQGSLQIASNSANGGRLNITGLPFTAASLDGLGGQTIFHIQISGGTGSQDSGYLASLAEGATQLQVQKYTGIGATNDSAVTMAADSFLLISGQYKAA